MTILTKGKVFRNDLEHWDGVTKTASRKDGTGGTVTGLVNGMEVDVLSVYGNSESYTRQTIVDCINRIGSASVTLKFNPGTWTIDEDLTIGSNFTCRIPNGCIFSVSSGKTLTFSGPVIRDGQTWTSGSGTVTENGTRYISGKVDLTGSVIQGTNALVFEGSSDDAFETTIVITNPTADRTITFPDSDVNLGSVPSLSGSNTFTGNNYFAGSTPVSFSAGIGAQYLQNCRISPSVATNALTVTLKGNDGNDPSATNIVEASFRSTTATSGAYNVRQVTSATSIVLPQGGTLGFTTSETGFIYVYLCDNGSTREIGLTKKALFDESTLHTTVAVGTGSDSDIVLYTTSLLTGAAVRLIGRITIQTGATPGDWSSSHTRLEPWTPSMKKTGDVVQRHEAHTSALITTTTATPFDDSIPQITEGVEVIPQAITPKSALNLLCVDAQVFVSPETADDVITAHLHKDSDANALKAASTHLATNETDVIHLYYSAAAGGTSAITMRLRAGRSGANTLDINGNAGARRFGGVANSYIRVWEEQA
jgi:hypothetical protein